MLIAQITDVHLGFDRDNPDELNRKRLDEALQALLDSGMPDLLLVTGDIADAGDDRTSYARFHEAVADLPFPVYPLVGNHDGRAAFADAFPQVPGGFVQYAIEGWPLRILVLDTLEEGRHGGAFCEERSAWLRERLGERPGTPTLIALHHPPIDSGLSWMSERESAPWMERLESVVSGADNVVALVAGHLHRPLVTRWAGTTLAVCPATAPQVALDLSGIDPDVPDDRPMIVAAPPAFALHLWNGRRLVTHFGSAGEDRVMARFTPALQPLVQMLVEEKRG